MKFALKEAIWHSLAHIFAIDCYRVNSFPSRLVVAGYGFMIIIIMNTYTANLAAFLTVQGLVTSIKGTNDLVGLAVASTPTYASSLSRSHISATINYGE